MMAPDAIQANARWKIRIDKSAFDKLKTEESFWSVVALSRVVNALRFVHSPLEHYQNNSPCALRVRYNSFLFNCALLWEASLFVQQLGKHHRHLPEFQAMVSILNAKDARILLESNLSGLRNRLVFHFGIDEIGAQVANLEMDEPIFVSAMGASNKQVYYELADLCAISTFAGPAFDGNGIDWQAVEDLIAKTTDLTLQFLTTAELFIAAVLKNEGWGMVTIPLTCWARIKSAASKLLKPFSKFSPST